MWVCEAWQVNIWTVFAVRPNGPKKNKNNNFASSRSDHLGSDKYHKAVVSKCGDAIIRFELWTQCCFGSVERMPDYDMETGMKMVEEQVFKWAPLSCHSLGSPPPFSKENNNDRILKNLFESSTSENKTVHKLLAFSGKRWNNFQPFGLQGLQRMVVWGFYENLS